MKPQKYIEISINFGDGQFTMDLSLDNEPIGESAIVNWFDNAKQSAIDHFRDMKKEPTP